MHLNQITEMLSVSPQITTGDIPAIKQAGFRSIICNRPDGEGVDQPTFKEVATAATAAGLEICYLPVQSGLVRDEDAVAFGAALRDLPGPVLAYCRSGTRSATLWSIWTAYRDSSACAAE